MSGSVQVQILLVACRRFVKVSLSNNGPDWKYGWKPFAGQPFHENNSSWSSSSSSSWSTSLSLQTLQRFCDKLWRLTKTDSEAKVYHLPNIPSEKRILDSNVNSWLSHKCSYFIYKRCVTPHVTWEGAKRSPSLKSVTYMLQLWNLETSKFCCIKKYRYRLHFDP